jgi:hypothetical protein
MLEQLMSSLKSEVGGQLGGVAKDLLGRFLK